MPAPIQPCYCNNHWPKLYAATVNVFPLRHNQATRRSLSLPVSRPTVGPASLLGFKKGLCAEWTARSSFGFPSYSSPLPLGSRHPDRKRSDPLLPSFTGVSSGLLLLVLVFRAELYDLGREVWMYGLLFPPIPLLTSSCADVIWQGFIIYPSCRPSTLLSPHHSSRSH